MITQSLVSTDIAKRIKQVKPDLLTETATVDMGLSDS